MANQTNLIGPLGLGGQLGIVRAAVLLPTLCVCLSAQAQSVMGTVTYSDCSEVAKPRSHSFRTAGRLAAEVAGAYAGSAIGEEVAQEAVGGWYARSVGRGVGARGGEKAVAAVRRPSPQSQEYRCLISVRDETDQEVDATYFGIHRPQIGTTVRVHQQKDGSFANTYTDD